MVYLHIFTYSWLIFMVNVGKHINTWMGYKHHVACIAHISLLYRHVYSVLHPVTPDSLQNAKNLQQFTSKAGTIRAGLIWFIYEATF